MKFENLMLQTLFSACLLICAPIGAWCGGAAIDALRQRGRRDAAEVVGLWVTIIFIPFAVAAPIVPQVGEMFFALAAQLLVAGAYQPVGASLLAQVTPQRLMGKITAIYLLVFTLLGRGSAKNLARKSALSERALADLESWIAGELPAAAAE